MNPPTPVATSSRVSFDKELHALYFLKNLKQLPAPYISQDNQRVVLAYFCIHGLAILGELHRVDREQIITWVYSLQVCPDSRERSINPSECGFRGGTAIGNVFGCPSSEYESGIYDTANIASTYAALCILRTLGDDLSRVDKRAVIGALRHLQNKKTGSFQSVPFGSEEDMRFVYCACAISYILNDWSGIDTRAVVSFINSCVSYDGGLGITIDAESHGGAVFCGIASLVLLGRLMQSAANLSELERWLVFRQNGGFQGRCNKEPDTCYAFWNGATLDLLGKHSLVDIPSCQKFVLSCQFPYGGICKFPSTVPDVMHSYYSLAWLSIAANQAKKQHRTTTSSTIGQEDDPFACLMPLDTKLQVPFFPQLSTKRG